LSTLYPRGYHPHATAGGVFHGRKDDPVSLTVQQLADLVHGTVHGDGAVDIQAARPLTTAQTSDI